MQTTKGVTETILVVDDEEAVRRFVKAALKKHSYHVLEAPSGEEALAVAEGYTGEIHLLLTDVVMPGISGKELSERLRLSRPSLRVLFISGYAAEFIAKGGVLGEGVAYLPKPFRPNELTEKVREILDGKLR